MRIKSGETYLLLVKQDTDVEIVNSLIFTLSGSQTVTKRYPEDVTHNDGQFFIPLTQEETIALSGKYGHMVRIECQINYKDLSVGKTSIQSTYFESTLATEIIENNSPSAYPLKEVTLDVVGGVIIASVSLQEIEDAKEEIKASALQSVHEAEAELDRKYAEDFGGCKFSYVNGRVVVEVEV